MLIKALNKFLDIIYPQNETELMLKRITEAQLFEKCRKTSSINSNFINSIFSYKDVFIKDAIYELKNNKNKYAINIFSKLLLEEVLIFLEENLINPDDKIPLTFIPQFKKDFLDKGFNQGELLVNTICDLAPKIFEKEIFLKKIKKTKPQHTIKNKKTRLKNLNGAFEIKRGEIKNIENKIIILIDDVYTTGATINEVRRKLLASGASQVIAFTIAH